MALEAALSSSSFESSSSCRSTTYHKWGGGAGMVGWKGAGKLEMAAGCQSSQVHNAQPPHAAEWAFIRDTTTHCRAACNPLPPMCALRLQPAPLPPPHTITPTMTFTTVTPPRVPHTPQATMTARSESPFGSDSSSPGGASALCSPCPPVPALWPSAAQTNQWRGRGWEEEKGRGGEDRGRRRRGGGGWVGGWWGGLLQPG
jgi:hypothetical protein